jgi:hypothetical protein
MKNYRSHAAWVPARSASVIAMLLVGVTGSLLWFAPPALAATGQSGAIGIQGIIPSPPPARGATIAVPANGAVFTSTPITVSGLCPAGLLVKIFDNGIFTGATVCARGSYALQIDLFSGRNDLVARVYDALDQAGPDSNTVTVTFNDAQFLQFGTQLTLGSAYAERAALPGTELDWPVFLSGGTGPYAISVDWGDGSSPDLLSVTLAGSVNLKHTYRVAGVYKVIIKATDKNGNAAFLQLVGQATGAIQKNKTTGNNVIIEKTMPWWPTLAMIPLIFVAFWLGGRYEHRRLYK